MATKDPEKLLRRAGPTVTCDLCPSFTLHISENTLDIELHTSSNGREWYFADKDLRAEFARKFNKSVSELPPISDLTVKRINQFKKHVSQMLIQEVKDEYLFRARPGLDDDDDDDEEDDGEEHA